MPTPTDNGAARQQNICILCTGNSCRSVMAERLLRRHHSDKYNVYSAGSHPAQRVNDGAVEVLREVGIDATDHQPHTLNYWKHNNVVFDYIITVCDDASESCPRPAKGPKVIHRGFTDPSHQPNDMPHELRMDGFRRVRDEIDAMCKNMPQLLAEQQN